MQRLLLILVGIVCASQVSASDEKVSAYALWCEEDSTLFFLGSENEVKRGDSFQSHLVTKLWKANEVANTGENEPGWRPVVANSLKKVVFDESFKTILPASTYQWFYQCKKLETIEGIENLNTSEVTTMRAMFSECENLKGLDVSGFNTSKVRVMRYMFANCFSVDKLNVSNFNTENVEDMRGMFRGCRGLVRLDVYKFNTKEVTDMSQLFYECSSLKEIDLKTFKTENVTDMSYMFRGCSSITNLDLKEFNTENVTDMSGMFYECSNLTGVDVSSFNTSKVKEMPWMFYGCSKLTQVDVSNFNTENVTNMRTAFGNCYELRLLDLNNWNTANVENMRSMFFYCVNLSTLKLDNFNTEKVKSMALMFNNCTSLENLDLSRFEVNRVEALDSMFYNDHELRSVIVGDEWNVRNTTSTNKMFDGCIKIVGEQGTTYVSKHINGLYARIDKEDAPGYFRKTTLEVKPILTLSCTEGGRMEFMDEKISGYTKSFEIDKGADVDVEYAANNGYVIDGGPSFSAGAGSKFGYNSHECFVYGMKTDIKISIKFNQTSEPVTQTIAFAEATLQTFSSTKALDFSDIDGLEAYIASGYSVEANEVVMSKVDKVPAETGLLLVGKSNTTYEVPFAKTDFVYSNLLVGVNEDESITNGYILNGDVFEAVNGTVMMKAGDAYLNIPSKEPKQLKMRFVDTSIVSGINEFHTPNNQIQSDWHTLSGTRLNGKPTQKGIYLNNGRKVLVK